MRRSCRSDGQDGAGAAADGWRLVGMAAAYFLAPLAAAIVAAAAFQDGTARIVAGLSALAAGLVAAAVGGTLLRRRKHA